MTAFAVKATKSAFWDDKSHKTPALTAAVPKREGHEKNLWPRAIVGHPGNGFDT